MTKLTMKIYNMILTEKQEKGIFSTNSTHLILKYSFD